jgi:hypothetical protein
MSEKVAHLTVFFTTLVVAMVLFSFLDIEFFSAIRLVTIVVATVVAAILFPLLEGESKTSRRTGPRGTARQNQVLEALTQEKQRVLRAIRDLDFDYDLDKLTDDAYDAQRVYLIRLAVAIMQRIDDLEAEIVEQEARINAAVAAFRDRDAA